MVVFACAGFFAGMGIRELWLAASSLPAVQEDVNSAEGQTQHGEQLPAIYAGQRLIIPVSGYIAEVSEVVSKGTVGCADKQIALTFDSGWLFDQTEALLDVLDENQVKSTFFLRGLWVQDHPDLVRSILNRGHTLGNHSLTHGHMRGMSDKEITQELLEATQIIVDATGCRPYLFRPPYGEYNSRMLGILGEQGYPYTVMWSLDSYDWARERNGKAVTEEYLIDRVLSNTTNNGIILMHVGGYETVGALPEIISGLKEQGYTLVRVTDMLPPPAGGQTIHTVREGDTLSGIAEAYGTTVEAIIAANNLE